MTIFGFHNLSHQKVRFLRGVIEFLVGPAVDLFCLALDRKPRLVMNDHHLGSIGDRWFLAPFRFEPSLV